MNEPNLQITVGTTYRLRNGRRATILSTSAKGSHPVVGLVHEPSRDRPMVWMANGRCCGTVEGKWDSERDIVEHGSRIAGVHNAVQLLKLQQQIADAAAVQTLESCALSIIKTPGAIPALWLYRIDRLADPSDGDWVLEMVHNAAAYLELRGKLHIRENDPGLVEIVK